MSSDISTDAPRLPAPAAGGKPAGQDAGFRPWQLFTLAALMAASIVAFYAGGRPPAVRVALILAVFAAATIGVAMLRTLSPFTSRGPAAPQIVGGRTRAALEREKSLALRSIKELEFDRAMGKLSDKDFGEMSARLRARAGRLIRELDADTGYRGEIEQEIARRLESPEPSAGGTGAGRAGTAEPEEESAAAAGPAACSACGTANDIDARFCKECGGRLRA